MVLVIILIIVAVVLVARCFKSRERTVNQNFHSESGDYTILGRKDNFTVTKDDRYEFHVVNGVIAEVYDKQKHQKVKYIG